jgi:translation initiation factor 1
MAKKSQRIQISRDKKRYGKIVTVVTGLEQGVDSKKIAKALKNELACGGTYKDGIIELQGDHVKRIRPILVKLGFDNDSIEGEE